MKKLLLITIGAALSFGATAQRTATKSAASINTPVTFNTIGSSTMKTTAFGDIDTLSHISGLDTLALYIVGSSDDSGFCAGMDAYGDMGFAERYDFNGADSTVTVNGVLVLFGGTVSSTSTKNVVFNVWSKGPQTIVSGTTTVFNNGFPNTVLTTNSFPFTSITPNTPQAYMFTTAVGNLDTFFVGFTIAYTSFSGDTIGLYSSTDGERTSAIYTVSGGDTIVNNVNASEYSDGTWHDNATDNFLLDYNYFLFPIVKIGGPLSVQGITRKNLTFFGNYPNPATDNTNIKFSLANTSDVTITIMDMAGHTVNTINESNMAAGMQIVPVSTTNMPAGDYLYLVRTTGGAGIAGKMTVIK